MIVHVLKTYGSDGPWHGIFSTPAKAEEAGVERAKCMHGGCKAIKRYKAETHVVCHDRMILEITDWEVDRALVDGKWKIL